MSAPKVAKEEQRCQRSGRDRRRAAAAAPEPGEASVARAGLASGPPSGIVHLGIGAFHRAHQAVYTAEAIERAGGDWGILGVAQRRPAAVEALAPQDGLFGVLERGPVEDEVTVTRLGPRRPARPARAGAARRRDRRPARPRGHADRDREGLPARPRDRRARRRRPRGRLGPERRAPRRPRSASSRAGSRCAPRRGEAGPLTVISCDNLPRNGEVLERLVRDFLARLPRPRGRPRDQLARPPRELPEHDGRPRRARHHGRGPRGGGAAARARGPRHASSPSRSASG